MTHEQREREQAAEELYAILGRLKPPAAYTRRLAERIVDRYGKPEQPLRLVGTADAAHGRYSSPHRPAG